MTPSRLLTALAATFTLAHCAQAHPGHGLGLDDPWHALTSLDHLSVLALIGAVLCLAGRLLPNRLPRRLVQGLGVAALAIAAVLWGLHT